ncbi:Imm42 family immunity protein [Psychrobacter sp. PAMC 21119]|uniref:Imm42 family immunity protein n=1 Tax=Psychrobacter sp. PAMC 21119 TaxID=1112209 RepID=UPI00028A0E67|nr:Imm42 family immunity protein [Psychrobacter sp. PAMC 21119]
MIFGKPEEFALYVDVIKERSNELNALEGVSGIWLKNELFITNTGLIALPNDFENIIEIAPQIIKCSSLYKLNNLDLLKDILNKRFPNWCVSSKEEWEKNIDKWLDIEEITEYDISLESCSIGNELNYYLLGIRNEYMMKILMYIKNKEFDFFDFGMMADSDVRCVEISYKDFRDIVDQLEGFIKKSRLDILGR